MKRIISINMLSAGNLLFIVYGVWGIVYLFFAQHTRTDAVVAPLGLILPKLSFTLNFSLGKGYRLLAPLIYAVTGWITGFAFAGLYNVLARAGLGIGVKSDA